MVSGGHNIKPPSQRVNRSRAKEHLQLVNMKKASQPALSKSRDWPAETREWWKMWGASPLTDDFTREDWSELLDTAVLHAIFWGSTPGSAAFFKASAQLRSRTANFGATPLDRQRLRIQFAFADEAEEKQDEARERRAAQKSSRGRRGPLVDQEDTA